MKNSKYQETMKEILENYSDEKIERRLSEWLESSPPSSWETVGEWENKRRIMVSMLLNEKLKRAETEYA